MARRLELVVTAGPLAGRRFVVTEAGLRLGRSSSNDIHVPDEELSRSHCLFEPVGETGVRLTDLASANGTYLNGGALGHEPVELKHGDRITAGETHLRVENPDGCDEVFAPPAPPARRIGPAAIAVLLALLAGVGALICFDPFRLRRASASVSEAEPVLNDAAYERVDADLNGIRRTVIVLSADGVLTRVVECAPGDQPRAERQLPLGKDARAAIREVLAWKKLKDIDREYAGPEPEPSALKSRQLKVAYDTRQRTIRVTNAEAPEAFRALCDRLESFAAGVLDEPEGGDAETGRDAAKGGAS